MSAPSPSERPLGDVLGRLAARTPAPGGGAAAALVGSVAAALVEMAAGFAGTGGSGHEARAAELRATLLTLAQRDEDSYPPVLTALKLPGDDPGRPEQVAAALSSAAAVPLQIADCAAEVARLAGEAAVGAGHLAGDAATAAVLAEAACAAAALLVELNLRGMADARSAQAEQLAELAGVARQHALQAARET